MVVMAFKEEEVVGLEADSRFNVKFASKMVMMLVCATIDTPQ